MHVLEPVALTLCLCLLIPGYVSGDENADRLATLVKNLQDLSRQVMLQQFFLEEKVRADGDSGIKVVRSSNRGRNNYDSETHIGEGAFAIHDHSALDRTLGLGEFAAVLNGIEFRTRHNDYQLVRPSTTSKEFKATENIEFPGMPSRVTSKDTLEKQIVELREWFRAFKDQDDSVRDYKKYFKPNLCYLEGTWTIDEEFTEPFMSPRHHLDANSWKDLQDKVRFATYSGIKHNFENFASLPTTIMYIDKETGEPVYAQWNYRILCHPIKRDIPFSVLQKVEDLAHRRSRMQTEDEVELTGAARFKFYEGTRRDNYNILDEVFAEVPGMDNKPGDITQEDLGSGIMYQYDSVELVKLNTGYYHRWYKNGENGAMGLLTVARGFNIDNLWVAQTTQSKVAPMVVELCDKHGTCKTTRNRFSFAIPLEIVFTTPLLDWNPYNLAYNADPSVTTEGYTRTGGESDPFVGTDFMHYYRTPTEFYWDANEDVVDAKHVLDPDGNVHKCASSGTRTFLQSIPGVGEVRLRWPIAPVHGEGSSVWKELNALRDRVVFLGNPEGEPEAVFFKMSATSKDLCCEHTHEVSMPFTDFKSMVDNGGSATATSTEVWGHTHGLNVHYVSDSKRFEYTECDGEAACPDGHPRELVLISINTYTNLP